LRGKLVSPGLGPRTVSHPSYGTPAGEAASGCPIGSGARGLLLPVRSGLGLGPDRGLELELRAWWALCQAPDLPLTPGDCSVSAHSRTFALARLRLVTRFLPTTLNLQSSRFSNSASAPCLRPRRAIEVPSRALLSSRRGTRPRSLHPPSLARIARTESATAPPPSSKRPVLARSRDVAGMRAAAAPLAVAPPVSDRSSRATASRCRR
jgi:hypothetical protein